MYWSWKWNMFILPTYSQRDIHLRRPCPLKHRYLLFTCVVFSEFPRTPFTWMPSTETRPSWPLDIDVLLQIHCSCSYLGHARSLKGRRKSTRGCSFNFSKRLSLYFCRYVDILWQPFLCWLETSFFIHKPLQWGKGASLKKENTRHICNTNYIYQGELPWHM